MHIGNQDFIADMRKQYPAYFTRANVLELGACDLNGSPRIHFEPTCRYVGVDCVAGPGVDIVSPAKSTVFFPAEFDTLVCLSMFEHDPDWRESFAHNLQWLRPGAMIFLGWGAEGNLPHPPAPWAIVPAADFAAFAATLPIDVLAAFFEYERYTPDCKGAYDAIARRR